MPRRQRKFEISILNVFLCLLVIFIHVTSRMITGVDKTAAVYAAVLIPWRLAAFAVQGFIFLSGLKLMLNKTAARASTLQSPAQPPVSPSSTEQTSESGYSPNVLLRHLEFLRKRFMSVILPYVLWVIIYYLYFCHEGYFPFNLSDLPGYLLRGNLVSHFYFVIVIAQFYLLAPLWRALVKKVSAALLLPVSLMLMLILSSALPSTGLAANRFAYTDRIFTTYLFYWTAGCLAGANYESFKAMLKTNRKFITAVFLFSTVSNAALSWLNFTGRANIPWLESVHILYCASAVIFFFAIAQAVSSRINVSDNESVASNGQRTKSFCPCKNVLASLIFNFDRVTYAAYLSHILVIFITDDYLPRLLPSGTSIWFIYVLRLCIIYTIVVSSCLLWLRFKTNFFSLFHKGDAEGIN